MHLSFAQNILIKWQILLPFHIISVIKSLTFHLPEAWKGYLFWVEPPCQDHYEEHCTPSPTTSQERGSGKVAFEAGPK